jgi:aerobic carbon-monoxide dehydrogenase medium subunit
MREFDYLLPSSIEQACELLAEYGDDARVFAGGTALMLVMRQRMLNPKVLVSLDKLAALRGIYYDSNIGLRIGALSLHTEVASHPAVKEHYPMLAHMAGHLANPQVRNQGTLGGNLCYADPATDPPGCLIALDAQVVLQSSKGTRTLAMIDFVIDYYTTALAADEILIAILIPSKPLNSISRYTRFRRTAAEHRPLLNVSFYAVRSSQRPGLLEDVRIVIAASTPMPVRLVQAEALLASEPITSRLITAVAQVASEYAKVLSDQRGSEAYRREIIRIVTRRSLQNALEMEQTL